MRGGLLAQLKMLRSGRHPVTLRPIPQPILVPELIWLRGGGESTDRVSDLKPQVHQLTSAERLAAMLPTVRSKEAAARALAALETADVEELRCRITGKRPLGALVGATTSVPWPSGKRQWMLGWRRSPLATCRAPSAGNVVLHCSFLQ